MGHKKDKRKSEGEDHDESRTDCDGKEAWQEKTKYLNAIAQPLAPRKLTKRLYKTVKKGLSQFCIVN